MAFDNVSDSFPWWADVLILLGLAGIALIVFIAFLYISHKLKRNPNPPAWFITASSLLWYGFLLLFGFYQLFIKHSFTLFSLYFWLLAVGSYFFFELSLRRWALTIAPWQTTVIGIFVIITSFATVYYPHIKAQWGGGALIPVEFTFLKDAPVRPGSIVDCSLIDETDSGFYVIGSGETSATFIPRSEVSSIYYGQGSKHLVFPIVPLQEAQPPAPATPPASQPPNDKANSKATPAH
jgi:hypothetical protein